MSTVISLFPNAQEAETAKAALNQAGIADEKISILEQTSQAWRRLVSYRSGRSFERTLSLSVVAGVVISTIIAAFIMQVGCQTVGCSPSINMGILITGLIVGIIGGGVVGLILSIDQLENGIYPYLDGVRHGQTLFVVETPETQTEEAMHILYAQHARDIKSI